MKIKKKDYEELLKPMQRELVQVQRWLQNTGNRVVVLLEGRDAAGKGGVINAIANTLNPRACRVVALPKPSDRERTQWYFQRYVSELPAAGEVVLFDRSWYNRAGVEKVMGYCSDVEYERFLVQAPAFEKMLVDDGVLLFKYWLAVDQDKQEQRFAERAADPLKRWKLSPVDLAARAKYAEYGNAREAMFRATHTAHAPWWLVDFNDQRRGRLNLIRHFIDHLPSHSAPEPDIQFEALPEPLLKERFEGAVQPIADRFKGANGNGH